MVMVNGDEGGLGGWRVVYRRGRSGMGEGERCECVV